MLIRRGLVLQIFMWREAAFNLKIVSLMERQYHPISVGLASYGMSGKVFHAPFLSVSPGFHLKKVVERHKSNASQDYPEVEVVRNFQEILDDASIELVIVNTPNALHFEMTKQALEAGKHVAVEKPLTPTRKEANTLIAIAKEKKKVLTVFQNRRWDSDFLTVHKVIAGNLLGRLVEYEAHYDRYVNFVTQKSWKEQPGAGSGILYNLGSHMIDQALVLFGVPEAVSADIGTQREGSEIDDFYDIKLYYKQFNVILKSSYLVREPGPRYILHGTKGSFIKYGIDPQEEALKAGRKPGEEGWGVEVSADWGKLNTEIDGLPVIGNVTSVAGSYFVFYDNLYEAIREGKELAVKSEEAALVIQIIELAYQSSKEGRRIKIS